MVRKGLKEFSKKDEFLKTLLDKSRRSICVHTFLRTKSQINLSTPSFSFRGYILLCIFTFFHNFAESEILRLLECGKISGTFSVVFPDKYLADSLLTYYKNVTVRECTINCLMHISCHSTNFIAKNQDQNGRCELNNRNISGESSLLEEKRGSFYSETPTKQSKVCDVMRLYFGHL